MLPQSLMENDLSRQILSDVTIYSKYARFLPELERRETWHELVTRNKLMHMKKFPSLWEEIEEAYKFVYEKKILPSMRSLQFSGKCQELNPARGFNCSYLPVDDWRAFSEIMFLLLGGTGVGFSVQTHHINKLPEIKKLQKRTRRFLVGDSIEGWADAVRALTKSYFEGGPKFIFDFSDIRPKGSRLITSGGKAPGPQPLKDCIHNLEKVFNSVDPGEKLTSLQVHDAICYIADAVLAGGIRRAALISLFSFGDEDMMSCKLGNWWELSPQRGRANNSVVLLRHRLKKKDFFQVWEKIAKSGYGEPGFALSNSMEDGWNPCGEASLKPHEFCNLTTINVSDVEDQKDLELRAKAASFIGTLQASYTDFHYLRDCWKEATEKDALLGVSMTGIASGTILELDLSTAARVVVQTNQELAKRIGINPAARATLLKPEGCQIASTLVNTKDGILSLEELGDLNGDRWQDLNIDIFTDCSVKKAPRFYINGLANTKKIKLDSGLILESTLKHKFRVLVDGEYIWKEASEIRIGDVLPYSVGEYTGGEIQDLAQIDLIKSKYASNCLDLEQPKTLDEDLAWFLGLYFADGSNHKKGIRISGDIRFQYGWERCKAIVLDKFNLIGKVYKTQLGSEDNRAQLYFNSVHIIPFLSANGISKQHSDLIEVPLIIRKSPRSVIAAFLDGFLCGDSCEKNICPSYVTVSKRFAEQIVVMLRAIGRDGKMREMPPTESSFGNKMRYWISERKGRTGSGKGNPIWRSSAWKDLDKLNLNHLHVDVVVDVQDSQDETFDIEVEEVHTYLANSYISHNTGSLVLGTSSGVHAAHSQFYVRRNRFNKEEPVMKFLQEKIPGLIEEDFEKPHLQSVVSFPIRSPGNSIFRTESAISLLERIKKFYDEWVVPGHSSGNNTHNISATVSVRKNEWDEVGEWVWKNREHFNCLSFLPYDDHSYVQAPFSEISEEEYVKLYSQLIMLDLSEISEEEDNTTHKEELACSGGLCSLETPHQ